MVSRDIIQRLLAIINDTRARLNTLESREVALLTATQTLTNKTLTTPTIGNFTNAQHAHTGATSGGTISHGSLTDLTTGDPHTQYLLESTYDANTILKADADNTPIALTVGASTIVGRAATGDIAALTAAQVATIVQGSIDHGSIAGLADDDHTGYARLAGRSGGQTLIGGTAANDDLTLEGTSNATRTTSYVILQPTDGRVGIGTTSPTTLLHLESSLPTLTIKGIGIGEFGLTILDGSSSVGGLTYSSVTGEQRLNGAQLYVYQTVYAGGAERMRITTGGNVGIGTAAPELSLSVQRTNNTVLSGTGFRVASFYSPSAVVADMPGVILGYDTTGAGIIAARTESAGQPLAFWTFNGSSWGERARISREGNVGIGTTDPDTRLDIDAGAIEFAEITAPIGGAVNTARLFCQDNGIGKTQLCVRFNTGAVQVIATQP